MGGPTRASTDGDVTQLLNDWQAGDPAARERLLPLVYDELRALARAHFAHERRDHTLSPTALVNEVLVRLLGGPPPAFENRRHFFGAAARAMRQILIDHARRRSAAKRGSGLGRVDLDQAHLPALTALDPEDVLALDDALERLHARDPLQVRIVELRYYLGFSIDEAAAALEMHPSAVNREWVAARAWLRKELRPPA